MSTTSMLFSSMKLLMASSKRELCFGFPLVASVIILTLTLFMIERNKGRGPRPPASGYLFFD